MRLDVVQVVADRNARGGTNSANTLLRVVRLNGVGNGAARQKRIMFPVGQDRIHVSSCRQMHVAYVGQHRFNFRVCVEPKDM